MQNYVIPGLQTVGGAVSEFFAPGNPIGSQQLAQGISRFAGEAAGGPAGPTGAVTPGSMGTPSLATTGAALPSTLGPNSTSVVPATDPSQPQTVMPGSVAPTMGPSTGSTTASADPTTSGNILAGLGPVGSSYLQYIQQMKLLKQRQKTDYAAPHSSASGQTSPLALQPPTPFAQPGPI